MAVMASFLADRLLQSGRWSITLTRKTFTTFALLTPALFMLIQTFQGRDPVISVVVFTASLFFNGAVTAGYLSNGLDIAPNFSGTIFGMANTMSSFGGWLSTKIVAILTKDEQTFGQWRYVFWILVGAYATGALVFLVLGSGVMQKWNSGLGGGDEDGLNGGKELQPLNKTEKHGDQVELETDDKVKTENGGVV